jgi:hypothetical protein
VSPPAQSRPCVPPKKSGAADRIDPTTRRISLAKAGNARYGCFGYHFSISLGYPFRGRATAPTFPAPRNSRSAFRPLPLHDAAVEPHQRAVLRTPSGFASAAAGRLQPVAPRAHAVEAGAGRRRRRQQASRDRPPASPSRPPRLRARRGRSRQGRVLRHHRQCRATGGCAALDHAARDSRQS